MQDKDMHEHPAQEAVTMRQIRIVKPKPARPAPEIDTRTPLGRVLPY